MLTYDPCPNSMAPMDLKHLRYLIATAEAGSVSAGARHLRVAQPAVSRRLMELENRLGRTLFRRTSRGVTLTQEGEQIYNSALTILRAFDTLPEVLEHNGREITGRVEIGLPTAASAVIAGRLLFAAMDRYPGIKLHLVESMSGFLREWIQAGRLDLAVLYDPEPNSSQFVENMVREELWLVGAPSKMAGFPSEISLKDIKGLPLVLAGQQHTIRELVDNAAMGEGFEPSVVVEADALHLVTMVVASGRAYGLAPRNAIWPELRAGTIAAVRIVNPPIRRTVALVRPIVGSRTPAVEAIGHLCMSIARELSAQGLWGDGDASATEPIEPLDHHRTARNRFRD